MRIALYQPEIPQNTGTLLRLGACLNVSLDIIEPCGFIFSDRRLMRSGMDYIDHADYQRHDSWDTFSHWAVNAQKRIILLTPAASVPYYQFPFQSDDILLLGQESQGVPLCLAKTLPHQVAIPMRHHVRSLNLATSAAMVIGEALRQTHEFPHD